MTTTPLFTPGLTTVTEDALCALNETRTAVLDLLLRHLAGDFGSLSASLIRMNLQAIRAGEGTVMSAYRLDAERRIWIVTAADWSQTKVHLFTREQGSVRSV